MYESFFGLSELPFELTANPKYLFLTRRQREAFSTLQYGLISGKALTVLIGEAGTGKTTLIRSVLESERCRHIRCVCIDNPVLKQEDFVRLLALRFNLGERAASSKAVLLERLRALLVAERSRGVVIALVVDEAQSLGTDLLEEVRLLANIETNTEKLLPLVLAGQPELAARLETPELRQLKQRVTLRAELVPFEVNDTAHYIASRITTAGGTPGRLFTEEAVLLVHECSRGIPRSINVICDNALLSAMGLGRQMVDRAIILEVCRDLRMTALPVPTFAPARPATGMAREGLPQGVVPAATPREVPLRGARQTEEAADRGAAAEPVGWRQRLRLRFGSSAEPTPPTNPTRLVT